MHVQVCVWLQTFLIKPVVAKKLATKFSDSLKYVVKTQMTWKNSSKQIISISKPMKMMDCQNFIVVGSNKFEQGDDRESYLNSS